MKPILKPLPFALMAALTGLLICGCAAREASKSSTVRLRFVPGDTQSKSVSGASWSALHPFPGDAPGVVTVMAHAGLGDSFPVREEGGPKLFDVLVTAGDDDHLRLEIRAADASQNIDLWRDKPLSVQVAGQKYQFSYPSVQVAPTARLTTTQAMLLVHRLP